MLVQGANFTTKRDVVKVGDVKMVFGAGLVVAATHHNA